MFEEDELAERRSYEFRELLNRVDFATRLNNCVLNFFGRIFRIKYNRKTSFKTQMVYEVIINIIITLQINSLLWYPDLKISGWSSYEPIWILLSYSSYDSICARSYIMNFCFYGTTSLFGLCLIFLSIFRIFLKIEKPIPIFLIIIFEKFIWITTTLCFIPNLMVLLMTLKYSLITSATIEEYSGDVKSDSLNYGSTGIVILIICFCILTPITIYSEIFSCDVKHTNYKRNVKARAYAQLDFEKKIYYVTTCIFYVTLGNDNAILMQMLGLIYSLYLLIKSIIFLPYYNIFENCIESCKMAAISVSLLIFLFATLLDNGTIILHFNIILQPIALYLVYRFIKFRYLNLKENKNIPQNQYEFELKYRDLLKNPDIEDKTSVLSLFKRFSEMSHFEKNKLFSIWEFNYCFFMVKDERLARVKLSKISKNPHSLEGDAHEWKIFNWLSINKRVVFFSDINYLTYLMELSNIRAKDEELCYILIDLEGEFSQRKPRIERIVDLVHHISDNIGTIKKGYKSILDKHKTIETFELYAGFLGDILSNYDEADQIASKKNGMNVYNQRNEDKRLEKYGKDVATMLISCSEESFGNILYINEKATQILKTSLIPSQEVKFTNFLPTPYDSYHIKLTKDFLSKCSSTDLEDHNKIFLEDQRGYLIECNLLMKLTAFHSHTYILLSFQQKKIDHQIAIISKEGIIQSHTELFPYYVGREEKLLKSKNLSELMTPLNVETMKDYEPWIIMWENRELAFIKIPKKIKSTVIYLLVVAYREEEILKWKTGEAQEQLGMISDQDMENNEESYSDIKERKKAEIKCHSIGEVTFSVKSLDKTETDIFTHNMDSSMIRDQTDHEKSIDEEHSKHVLSKKNFAKKLLIESRRTIRVLQWVLFFVILSGTATVIAIAAYMVVDVSHSTSLSAFNRMGQLLYDIGICSDSARTINRVADTLYFSLSSSFSASTLKENLETSTNNLNTIVTDLENIQSYLLDDFSKWSYCDNSDILKKPYIPIWVFNGDQVTMVHENLFDTVSRFIYNGHSLIQESLINATYHEHAKFLMINGLGFTWDYFNKTMAGVADCEHHRVKITGSNIRAFLYVGFSTLGALYLILIIFILLVSRKHDEFWTFVLNNAGPSLSKLKLTCIDRLITAHGVDYASETKIDIQKHIKKTIKTTIYISYIWRVTIFLAIVLSYYLLLQLYLYPKCETMMVNRPEFINTFNLKRSLLSRLLIFSRDAYSPYFFKIFNENYDFPSSKIMIEKTAEDVNDQVQALKNQDFIDLMSNELKRKIFEFEKNSTVDFSQYGIEDGVMVLVEDLVSYSHGDLSPPTWLQKLVDISAVIQTQVGEEFDLADRDSKKLIEDQLDIIIDVMAIYASVICGLFLLYYLPYLNRQINKLKKFAILPAILSMEAD